MEASDLQAASAAAATAAVADCGFEGSREAAVIRGSLSNLLF